MSRQDMFPTQVGIWKSEPRIGGAPIGNGDAFSAGETNPITQYLKLLAQLRKTHMGLGNKQMQLRYSKGPLLVISKRDPVENREYLVAFNNSKSTVAATIQTSTKSNWRALLGNIKFKTNGSKINVKVAPFTAAILRADSQVTETAVKPVKLTAVLDDLTSYIKVSAAVSTTDMPFVEFFAKPKGSEVWTSLGVDTNAPYSVYVNPADYTGIPSISLKAVITNSQGKQTEMKPINFVIPN
jgi:alpha-amylase